MALLGVNLLTSDETPSTQTSKIRAPAEPRPVETARPTTPGTEPVPGEAEPEPAPEKPEPSNVVPYHMGATALKGMEYKPISPSEKEELGIPEKLNGVMITEVDPRSAAAEAKLRQGDVIVKANFEKLTEEGDLEKFVGDRGFTALVVYRGGSPMELVIHKPFQPKDAGPGKN